MIIPGFKRQQPVEQWLSVRQIRRPTVSSDPALKPEMQMSGLQTADVMIWSRINEHV